MTAHRALSKKVCLLGDFAVGKTSLTRRFVYNRFDDRYKATIGVSVSRRTVLVPTADELVELTMIVWDLAGGEAWSRLHESYMRGAAGAILVTDLTRPSSTESLVRYTEDLRKVSPNASLVIAANKEDLAGASSALEPIADLSNALRASFYTSSAKTGAGVDAIFRRVGELIVGQTGGDDA